MQPALEQRMEYGPEHVKVIRQVFGNQADLPVARDACCHEIRSSLNTEVRQAPLHLYPNYRAKPERLQRAIGKLLHLLTGQPFPGRDR